MSIDVLRAFITFSAILYYISLFFFIKNKKLYKILWGCAITLNITLVVNNWITNGYMPFVGTFQVLIFVSFCFFPVYLYMKYIHDCKWMAGYFILVSAICLTGVMFMNTNPIKLLPPALQSVWFIPHILMYMFAYAIFAVSFIITILNIFAPKPHLNRGIYNLVCTAFPFATCGMLFGAIWANEAWGGFWSFDAKENWSLITWCLYALYLHFYRNNILKRYANILSVLGFVALIITMFFVRFFSPESLHIY